MLEKEQSLAKKF